MKIIGDRWRVTVALLLMCFSPVGIDTSKTPRISAKPAKLT
jgi:hypothetical protein